MDALLHFLAGFFITLSFPLSGGSPEFGLGAGITAGIGKEIYDSQYVNGEASTSDALYTAAGSLTAYGLNKYVFKLEEHGRRSIR